MNLNRGIDNIVIDLTKDEISEAKSTANKLAQQHYNSPTFKYIKGYCGILGVLAQKAFVKYCTSSYYTNSLPEWVKSQIETSPCYDENILRDEYDFTFRGVRFDIKGSPFREGQNEVKWHDRFLIQDSKKLVHEEKGIENYLFIKITDDFHEAVIAGMFPFDDFWTKKDSKGRNQTTKSYNMKAPESGHFVFGGQLYSFKDFIHSP